MSQTKETFGERVIRCEITPKAESAHDMFKQEFARLINRIEEHADKHEIRANTLKNQKLQRVYDKLEEASMLLTKALTEQS